MPGRNRLNGNSGNANYTFSKLDEDLWTGGADLSYLVTTNLSVTVGGAYTQSATGLLEIEIFLRHRLRLPGQ